MKTATAWILAALSTVTLLACDPPDGEDGPYVADVLAGDCEGSGMDAFALIADAPPALEVIADGSTVLVTLHNIDANCCPSPDADVTVSPSQIEILFEDVTADDACGCTCITDFDIEVSDVEPGLYSLDVYVNGGFFETAEVEVS